MWLAISQQVLSVAWRQPMLRYQLILLKLGMLLSMILYKFFSSIIWPVWGFFQNSKYESCWWCTWVQKWISKNYIWWKIIVFDIFVFTLKILPFQDVIVRVVRNEGVFALWKGFTPCYMRIGPHTILTFLFLEQLQILAKKVYGVN